MNNPLANIPPLPQNVQTDGDIDSLYLKIITDAITSHPRSQQTRLGPSELGDPCSRRIIYKLTGTPEKRAAPNWKATVGTALHAWLEVAFQTDNQPFVAEHGTERWLTETRLTVGAINGKPVTGSCDLYDRVTGTVIDHKTVGPTQLDKYRRTGPGPQYRIQAHLYGLGWLLAGQPVNKVMIAFLPRNGELAQAHLWSAPFDPQQALHALQRVEALENEIKSRGKTGALLAHDPIDAYCTFCPFFQPGITKPECACPGALPTKPAAPAPLHFQPNQSIAG